MNWSDFLRYSKYIAVFYGIAFTLVLTGIWLAPSDTGWKFFWSGVVFGVTSAAANICLGIYHSNHKTSMAMEKNIYLATQEQAQVITSDDKGLLVAKTELDLERSFREIARKVIRDERGY